MCCFRGPSDYRERSDRPHSNGHAVTGSSRPGRVLFSLFYAVTDLSRPGRVLFVTTLCCNGSI